MRKRVTKQDVQAKIEALCDTVLLRCHLDYEAHWGRVDYWLVFPGDEDFPRSKLHFERISDVWDWLTTFERDHKPQEVQP